MTSARVLPRPKSATSAWADLARIVYLYLMFPRISGCSTFVRWRDQFLLDARLILGPRGYD